MQNPRHTARAIVIHDQKLLLIERYRGNLHYYSIPGGGIEAGETPEEAVIREVAEETSCMVRLKRPLYLLKRGEVQHHFFLCEYVSGDVHLPADSPEALHRRPDNRFIPKWMPLDELAQAPFLIWKPIQEQLLHDLQYGFSDSLVEIVADPVV
jgi:ADP-ribose pyrophosphatase YjhB (NUDIX family)